MLSIITFMLMLYQTPSCSGTSEYGLCSQVYLMSRYCSNHDLALVKNDVLTANTEYKVGKAGPPGVRGERGPPGIVNYTEVERRISNKILVLEKKFDSRLSGYNELLIKSEKLQQSVLKLEEKFQILSTTGCHDVDLKNAKETTDKGGVFDVYAGNSEIEIFCDSTTDNGNWTVFQRRLDGTVDFDRNWDDYVRGFGNKTGEFWLGLDNIHQLTKDKLYELRIDMTDNSGNVHYAKYSTFAIANEINKYKITIAGYSGNATDSLAYHNNMPFSTKDRDQDPWSLNCALFLKGGWWFNQCEHSNLNGHYDQAGNSRGGPPGIYWARLPILKKSEMKFRKKTL